MCVFFVLFFFVDIFQIKIKNDALESTEYIIELQVLTELNTSNYKNITIIIDSMPLPEITLEIPYQWPANKLLIVKATANINMDEKCKQILNITNDATIESFDATFHWQIKYNNSIIYNETLPYPILEVLPNQLQAGKQYELQVEIHIETSLGILINKRMENLLLSYSNIQTNIIPSFRKVNIALERQTKFSANQTIDPNFPNSLSHLRFTWTCQVKI